MKRARGGQSTFTPEKGAEIVKRLKTGEPLAVICRGDGMPCDDTVRNWAEADEAFGRDIARAREIGFDAIAAECLRIADGKDKPTPEDLADFAETGQVTVRDHNRDRLRVDTRLKLLAKWDPKRYGEKTQVDVGVDASLRSLIASSLKPA